MGWVEVKLWDVAWSIVINGCFGACQIVRDLAKIGFLLSVGRWCCRIGIFWCGFLGSTWLGKVHSAFVLCLLRSYCVKSPEQWFSSSVVGAIGMLQDSPPANGPIFAPIWPDWDICSLHGLFTV